MIMFHKDGGNYYDNICIDLDEAFRAIPSRNRVAVKLINRSFLACLIKGGLYYFWQKTDRMETRVMIGVERGWFDEFVLFWRFLGGRPISIVDFHGLRLIYRIRNQNSSIMNWNDNSHHLNNWKDDRVMGVLLNQLYQNALKPFRDMRYIPKKAEILEYGCSHAPYYRSYRKFYGYKKCKWTLADIENHSFLYSKYCYRSDDDIDEFIIIDERNIDNPLPVDKKYDVIYATAVFEHLHAPRHIAEVLLDHLRRDGLFVFDYIKSDAKGLDSRQGLEERENTINYIKSRCILKKGDWSSAEESIGLCYARLKKEGS